MDGTDGQALGGKLARHPLIAQIGQLAAEVTGKRLLIVYPTPSGWGQVFGDARSDLKPAFCRLVQGSGEGARHCRMCHILMTVSACGGGPTLQRCHAGCSVMVYPAAGSASEAVAIVSSCVFSDPKAWEDASARGRELGINIRTLRSAFRALPVMDERQRGLVGSFMRAMSLAVQAARRNDDLETSLDQLRQKRALDAGMAPFFKPPGPEADRAGDGGGPDRGRMPPLVRVVCELVRQRPDLPLAVKELAAASRVTPNHFTSLFSRWTGQSFSDYLTSRRMARAQELLGDLTLHIGEIGRQVGYEDPGYFARRFRQQTGLTPRQWREQGAAAHVPAA